MSFVTFFKFLDFLNGDYYLPVFDFLILFAVYLTCKSEDFIPRTTLYSYFHILIYMYGVVI